MRKFSHEEAKERKEDHEASGGNKSKGGDIPDPEEEDISVQVRIRLAAIHSRKVSW